ncbi:MAG: DNA polymerase III subunit gamma/tau, partial [Firmicutes bacterium]|nr:DNA polymerase III subunit gamma/tau [Bacillota bacterium]
MQPPLTLYRKWRPQRFEQVVGQAHVVRTLAHALARGRTAHAYLFAGPRGTGKTTLARLLAKGLNCAEGPTPEPCNACASCRQITEGSSLDVMEIDGASNRGIDEIRELRERVRFAPAQSRYKVYIIDEVHMLTNEAFNALLKMLEEPPPHVVFIFATTEPQRVPATILSRCQRFDFRRLTADEIIGHLAAVARAEGVEAEPEALDLLARHADGGVRDALSMLEQCMAYSPERLDASVVAEVLGLVRPEALAELARHFVDGDVAAGLALIGRLTAEEGVDPRLVAKELLSLLRDAAAHKLLSGKQEAGLGVPAPTPGAAALGERSPLPRLVAAMESLIAAEPQMRWAPDPRLVLELALMRLARPAPEATPPPPSRPVAEPSSPSDPVRATAPAPSPAVSPPAAPRPQGGPLLLDEVQRRWGDGLTTLRNQQRRSAAKVEALLREGRPIRVDGLEITIGFPEDRAFHRNAVEGDEKARQLVEKVCARLLGRPVTIRTEIVNGESASPPEPAASVAEEPAEPAPPPRPPAPPASARVGPPSAAPH